MVIERTRSIEITKETEKGTDTYTIMDYSGRITMIANRRPLDLAMVKLQMYLQGLE